MIHRYISIKKRYLTGLYAVRTISLTDDLTFERQPQSHTKNNSTQMQCYQFRYFIFYTVLHKLIKEKIVVYQNFNFVRVCMTY